MFTSDRKCDFDSSRYASRYALGKCSKTSSFDTALTLSNDDSDDADQKLYKETIASEVSETVEEVSEPAVITVDDASWMLELEFMVDGRVFLLGWPDMML